MYGSWYWGSQASSWIFWWAFARLCRLTSTPHGWGRGLLRCRGPSAAGAQGARGSAFSVPRKPRRTRASWTPEAARGAARCPLHRAPRATDHSGSPGREWSQYETSLDSTVPRVGLPRVGRPGAGAPGARPAVDALLRDEGGDGCP